MAQRSVPETAYRVFSARVHDRVATRCLPVAGDIELTQRCNLRCGHCYGAPGGKGREMTLAEICRIFDEIAEAGCLWLLLTGGEALLREDFADIYLYAKEKGFIVTLFTNATLVTPRIADLLKERPPFRVEVSLYGASREVYEKVTGAPGSHKKCLEGIEMLRERGVSMELKTLVTNDNKAEIAAIQRFAKQRGLFYRFDAYINPRLDGSQDPCRLRLTPEEVVALDLSSPARCDTWRQMYKDVWGAEKDLDHLYACTLNQWSFFISAAGRLQSCLMLPQPSYDVLHRPFLESWQELVPAVQGLKSVNRGHKCYHCEMSALCCHCPAWAELENGDPESAVDFVCRTAQLRHRVFQERGIIGKNNFQCQISNDQWGLLKEGTIDNRL